MVGVNTMYVLAKRDQWHAIELSCYTSMKEACPFEL